MGYVVVLVAIALRVMDSFRKPEAGRFERVVLVVEGVGYLMVVFHVG